MFITKVILAFKLHILFITCYIPLHILFYVLYTRPFSYKHVMYLEHAPSPTLFPFHLFQTVSLLLSSPYMCVYNICDQYVRSLMYLGVYTHSYICVHIHMYIYMSDFYVSIKSRTCTQKKEPPEACWFLSWLGKLPLAESHQVCTTHQQERWRASGPHCWESRRQTTEQLKTRSLIRTQGWTRWDHHICNEIF